MRDPSLPVQKAVFEALTAALGADVPVYDEIPADEATGKISARFPFVSIGDDQVVSDVDQCHDPSTVYCTVQVWSRAVGRVEAKTIMARVCLALDVRLVVEGFEVIANAVDDGPHHFREADRRTSRSVATFRYRMGPVA